MTPSRNGLENRKIMFEPSDTNVIKTLKSIDKAKLKLEKLQELCVHEKVSMNNWKDTWNSWDYPCYSKAYESFQCIKCGLITSVQSTVRHVG